MASIRKLPDGRWQAQYRPVPGGKQITRTTRRKVDAQRWLDEQTTALVTGNYVDPNAGQGHLRRLLRAVGGSAGAGRRVRNWR